MMGDMDGGSYNTVWHEYVSSQLARMAQRCTDLDARADAIMAELSALSRRVARLEVAAHGYPPMPDGADVGEGTEY